MDIMNLPDREARLRALRRYLAAAVGDRSATRKNRGNGDDGDGPPDPRLATNGAQRGAAILESTTYGATSGYPRRPTDNSGREDSTRNEHSRCAHTTTGPQRGAASSECYNVDTTPSLQQQRGQTVDDHSHGWSTHVANSRGAADRDCEPTSMIVSHSQSTAIDRP